VDAIVKVQREVPCKKG